jgi:hypothetical protein
MNPRLLSEELSRLATKELETVLRWLPGDRYERFTIFMDATRMIDYWTVFQELLPEDRRLAEPDYQVIAWGWNLAAAHLFSAISQAGIPIAKAGQDRRSLAMTLLHQLGRSVLMRRAATMVSHGLLVGEQSDSSLILRRPNDDSMTQFVDLLEHERLAVLEDKFWKGESTSVSDAWTRKEHSGLGVDHLRGQVGSFLTRRRFTELDRWTRSDIDDLMRPLVRPWQSGYGLMTAYDAAPEVDDHFLAEAARLTLSWQEDGGIHSDVDVGGLSGADVCTIAMAVAALHLKHVALVLTAVKNHPEILIPESLTIWSRREDMERSIADYSGLPHALIRKSFSAISMRETDASSLAVHTTPFRPLLLDLENGTVLRPISSLNGNPLQGIRRILEWRDPSLTHTFMSPREAWMRSEIYALFQGTRYSRVEGAVKLREGAAVATDIDAAVLDETIGALALFQIKWQDFNTNDVRQLRSKAKNLVSEFDLWANRVSDWVERHGLDQLAKALRLRVARGTHIRSCYLFGISRAVARVQGYGFEVKHPKLAIANWPQFLRVRYETGPTANVFGRIHKALQEEMAIRPHCEPLPATFKVAGMNVEFRDFWTSLRAS